MLNNFVPAIEDIGDATRARMMLYQGQRAVHAPLSTIRDVLDVPPYVTTRTALKALNTNKDKAALLLEEGREGVFIWTEGDYSAQVTADSQEGIYVKADDTASSDGAWIRLVTGDVLGNWFGMVGDGTTDNWTPFTKAMTVAASFGRRLRVPKASDNYLIDLSTDRSFVIPANLTLYMERGATLEVDGTGTRFPFHIDNDDITLERFNLTVSDMATSGTLVIFLFGNNGSNFRMDAGDIDGGIVESGGAINWVVQLARPALDEGFTGIYFGDGIDIRNYSRFWYRDSADTGTLRNLKFKGWKSTSSWSSPIALNTPSGICEDVEIDGITSQDNFAKVVANSDTFHIGIGSAKNVRVTNCRLRGAGNGIHSEESTENSYIAGNVVELTDADAVGYRFTDNNVAGSYVAPRNNQIINNTAIGPGMATSTGQGFLFANDASGVGADDGTIITGNIAEGFDRGFAVDDAYEAFYALIEGNMARECNTGFFCPVRSPRVQRNKIIDCDDAYEATVDSGDWGANTTINRKFGFLNTDTLAAKLPGWTSILGSSPPGTPVQWQNGQVKLNSGANAAASVAANGVAIVGPGLINFADRGRAIFEAKVKLSSITNAGCFIGLTDNNSTIESPLRFDAGSDVVISDATDAVGICFNTGAATDNWKLTGVANNVDAATQDFGSAPVADTYETWRVELNERGQAFFFRNGNTLAGTRMSAACGVAVQLYPILFVYARAASSIGLSIESMKWQSGV